MELNVEDNTEPERSVKTFVLFDTETTGLQSPGNNPRITELCFIALTREELLTQQRASRVLNKLLLCFNPYKNICHLSSKITGLHNDALEDLAPFRKQAPLISTFLKNLPQPACLIAHNGNGFDFPLLVSHLKNAKENVPEGILCVDSLEAFRMFDGLPPVPEFVLQRRKANMASLLTKEAHSVKSSNMIKELKGNRFRENRTTEDVEGIHRLGDHTVSSSDLQKRSADSDSLFSHDVKPKQAKLSLQETPVWEDCEPTPQKSSVDITGLNRSVPTVRHSGEGQHENVDKVKRQLFEKKLCATLPQNEGNANTSSKQAQSNLSSPLPQNEGNANTSSKQAQSNLSSPLPQNEGNASTSPKQAQSNLSSPLPQKESDASISPKQAQSNLSSPLPQKESDASISPKQAQSNLSSPLPQKESDASISPKQAQSNLSSPLPQKESDVSISPKQAQSNLSSPLPQKESDASMSPQQAQKVSYSLSDVYFRVFGQKPEVAHTAEDDCFSLLKIICNNMHRFPTWCDRHAVLLSSIQPMY